MSVEIVTCPPDRFRDLLAIDEFAFGEPMPPGQIEGFERYVDKSRFFTGIDDGVIVSTCGIFSFRMTVPGGGQLPVAGVTFVAVLPSHRRQGLATAMMRRMFEDARGRGEPIAILWASEGAIYQRFGYGLATLSLQLRAETRSSSFAREWPREGHVRVVPLEESLDLIAPIYDAVRRHRAGMLERSPEWWRWTTLFDEKRGKGDAKRVAVYEGESGPEAYAIFRMKAAWDERGTSGRLKVAEAFGSTPAGYRAIWRWLFDVDLMRTLRVLHLPPDDPLLLLAAEPRRLGVTVGDGIWLRVLDVAAALEGRRYEADGVFTFELRDEFCPWNAGRWTMRVADGEASVSRTEADPDLELDANDLAAMYLGGFGAVSLERAGRVVERRAGAASVADRLFRTALAPWSPMEF